jgi:LDH2 family malate/lactate/ureidoglycolate dehydrogenase
MNQDIVISVDVAIRFMTKLFQRAGLPSGSAFEMGSALVEADVAGLGSHGLLQAEMYVRRLRLGSISPRETAVVVENRDATAVLDAQGMFGHLAGRQAMDLAMARSKSFGVGVVAVRNSFHFGAAGRYSRQASEGGCIGVAMCNTKPMMPAPDGLEKLVGNNPISIGLPAGDDSHFLLDMALSEGALGKIRVFQREGRPIPSAWAVDKDGNPTTDPNAAIDGMLLPSGGAKGFGLAMAIDLMSSLLSAGPGADAVPPLYGDLSRPFVCSLLLLAINIDHFGPLDVFMGRAGKELAKVRQSKTRTGNVRVPGDRLASLRSKNDGTIRVGRTIVAGLNGLAGELAVEERLV